MSIGSNSEVDEQNCEQEHLVDSVARHVPDENVALYSLSPKKKYLYTVIQYTIHICTPASSLDHKDHIPLFPPTSSPFQGSASTTKPSVPIFPLQVRLHQHRCSHRGGRAAARHAALDDGGYSLCKAAKRGTPRTGLGSFARGAAALQSPLRQWLQAARWQLPRPGSTAGCPVRSQLPPQYSHHRLGSDCRKRCHSDDKHMACHSFDERCNRQSHFISRGVHLLPKAYLL